MLSDEEAARLCQVIKKVNVAVQKVFGTSAYLLLQKNGKEVFQTVPHVHFHFIPRKKEESSFVPFVAKILLAGILPPLSSSEMEENVSRLKCAMAEH
jgi:diadenosine tetraphosphate (Ap4A) HIT family hydrolase